MISSEVQRTLVKSPPELWAEISDPDALARHLGEFGEIHITRLDPEQRVEWEAGDASGSVVIKPSGWGTKVRLTVTRELAESECAAVAETEAETRPEPDAASESEAQPQVAADAENAQVGEIARPDARDYEAEAEAYAGEPCEVERTEPEQAAFEQAEPDDVGVGQADDHAERQAAPEPRRGFFARLFGRRRAERAVEPTDQPEPPRDAAAQTVQPGPPRDAAPQAIPPARYNALAVWASQIEAPSASESPDAGAHEPDEGVFGEEDAPADISAQITAAEEVAAEEVTAVLTGVLDRLGAAHHRPFSRA